MRKDKSLREIGKMSSLERWEMAKNKLSDEQNEGIVPALLNHMRIHENNQWLNYSPRIADQIPHSYAAHAFGSLQISVLHYEFIRICTFWDPVDLDSRSIPTIVALADCKQVKEHVYQDHFAHYEHYDLQHAGSWGKKARRRLNEGIRCAKEVEGSDILGNARNYRDKLAHLLVQTREEQRRAVPSPLYGDEKKLLRKTVTTVDRLYCSLNGIGFDWSGATEMHKRNAKSFWEGISINVSI